MSYCAAEGFVVSANRLSGSLPTELGAVDTLLELSVDSNAFSGSMPTELSRLVKLSELADVGQTILLVLPID